MSRVTCRIERCCSAQLRLVDPSAPPQCDMSESPTVTTLESLLRANSTQLPAATSTGKTSAHSASATRPALSTSTWGSAVTGLFGYGGNGRDGTGGVTQNGRDEDDDAQGPAGGAVPRKARPRASIPSWEADSPTENAAGHTDQGDKTNEVRDSLDAGADPELEHLVKSILWEASLAP